MTTSRIWENSKNPVDKSRLNKAIKELKYKLAELKEESTSIVEFLKNVDPNRNDDCNLQVCCMASYQISKT